MTSSDSLTFCPEAILAILNVRPVCLLQDQLALLQLQEAARHEAASQVSMAAASSSQELDKALPMIRLLIAPSWGEKLGVEGGMIWLQGFHDKLYVRVLGEVNISAMRLTHRTLPPESRPALQGDLRSRRSRRRGSATELACKHLSNPGKIFALPLLNARAGAAQLWRCREGSALQILGAQEGVLELRVEQDGVERSLGMLSLAGTSGRIRMGGADPALDEQARLDSVSEDLHLAIRAYHSGEADRFHKALRGLCSYRGGERTLGRWQNIWLNALAAELIRCDRELAHRAGCGQLREYGQLLFSIDASL